MGFAVPQQGTIERTYGVAEITGKHGLDWRPPVDDFPSARYIGPMDAQGPHRKAPVGPADLLGKLPPSPGSNF